MLIPWAIDLNTTVLRHMISNCNPYQTKGFPQQTLTFLNCSTQPRVEHDESGTGKMNVFLNKACNLYPFFAESLEKVSTAAYEN